MKVKNVNLKWYAIKYDSNQKKVKNINVLEVIKPEEIRKRIKYKGQNPNEYNYIKNEKQLEKYITRELMYYYWSKAEQEMMITDLFDENLGRAVKVDVFTQLAPNLELITKYIIKQMNIKFKED